MRCRAGSFLRLRFGQAFEEGCIVSGILINPIFVFHSATPV
jgi:hypothetical protein